jgi:hypothetical protein
MNPTSTSSPTTPLSLDALTRQQRRLAIYLYRYTEAHHYLPTMSECGEAIGGVKQLAHYHLDGLVRKGVIGRRRTRGRGTTLWIAHAWKEVLAAAPADLGPDAPLALADELRRLATELRQNPTLSAGRPHVFFEGQAEAFERAAEMLGEAVRELQVGIGCSAVGPVARRLLGSAA